MGGRDNLGGWQSPLYEYSDIVIEASKRLHIVTGKLRKLRANTSLIFSPKGSKLKTKGEKCLQVLGSPCSPQLKMFGEVLLL
eukprot:scaffold4392_cov63-Cyclotella_meneghiniana.AAC.6